LLEGLEISEITLNNLKLDNEKFRLDDEFFQKHFTQAYKLIKTKPFVKFGSVMEILTDYHANGSYEVLSKNVSILDEPNFAYMVRSTDLEKLDFESDVKYVTESAYNYLAKTKLFGGELLINKIGSPGRVYLMPNLKRPVSVGMNLFMVRLNKNCGFNEHFLWAFFNSSLGQKIIMRKVNGTVPLTIDKEAVRSLYLPQFSGSIQNVIKETILESERTLVKAKEVYSQAEQTLLEAVGLADFKPSTQNTNIKTFAQSFGRSGRLDAEYYQPKYEEVMAKIASQSHAKLVDVVTIKKSIEPGSDAYADEGLPFIRVSDFSKYGLTTPDKCLSDQFVEANLKLLNSLKPKQNTILFSKDGSVGTAYLLREDLHGVTSGAILHLSLKRDDVLPEYLTLVLNSKLVQMQAERDAGGSIILHWRVGEIENVLLPIIDPAAQTNISQLVQQSFTLKAQSEHLLNVAKRAVEMAIEQDEVAGLAYIKQEAGITNAT
jgi:type I restriction enzyme, S subunit